MPKFEQRQPWYNAIQWSGQETPQDFVDFFSGPDGLNINATISARIEEGHMLVNWGSPIGEMDFPLGTWILSRPSWGEEVTPGASTDQYSEADFNAKFITV